jgi:hypothetical protein
MQNHSGVDTLVAKEPEVAFDLLDKLVYTSSDTATPSARPRWRDDDAGAGYATTHASFSEMYLGAADRLIRLSAGNAGRLAALIDKVESLDTMRSAAILKAVGDVASPDFSDEDREIVRAALRRRLHWHRNYDQEPQDAVEAKIAPLQQLYDALLPSDLIVRHSWLFSNGWPDPPARVQEDGYSGRQAQIDKLRLDAVQEIHASGGLDAVARLARRHPGAGFVGWSLAKVGLSQQDIAAWVVANSSDLSHHDPLASPVSGLLFGTPADDRPALLDEILARGLAVRWDENMQARLLALAPHNQTLWDYVERRGPAVAAHYWATAAPGFVGNNEKELEYAARKLLAAQRTRSALSVCRFDAKKIDPELLATLLERFLAGDESTGPLPDSWHVREMLARLQAAPSIDRGRLIRLEFGLIPALGYDKEGVAKTLYAELLSNPAFFVEVLKLVFRPATAGPATETTEHSKTTAQIAFRVLMHCKQVPGLREDGTVDEEAFARFVERGRTLATDADRLDVFDDTLGEILAYAPPGSDGIWPFKAARDFLDRPELKLARDGLRTSLFNKRGMVSKAYAEGGTQERELATTYEKQAAALHQAHPHLAAVLDELASNYEKYARSEDVEAQLRLEGE